MQKILFIDTMATGMNPERCAIYRLGGIYTENGVEKARFEFRACPWAGAKISEQSLWICSETRASLARYPKSEDAFRDFIAFLDKRIDVRNPGDKAYIAGFNASALDVPFLREWFRKNGNERFRDYFYVQTLDLMSVSAFALINERRDMQGFHLNDVAQRLDIYYPGNENYDCIENSKVCLDIFRLLQRQMGINDYYRNTDTCEKVTRNFTPAK